MIGARNLNENEGILPLELVAQIGLKVHGEWYSKTSKGSVNKAWGICVVILEAVISWQNKEGGMGEVISISLS